MARADSIGRNIRVAAGDAASRSSSFVRVTSGSGASLNNDLQAFWNMEEASFTTRLDSGPSGYDLTDFNSDVERISGLFLGDPSSRVGAAAKFNFTFLGRLRRTHNLDLSANNSTFTISTWVKHLTTVGPSKFAILSKSSDSDAAAGFEYSLYLEPGSPDKYVWRVSDGTLISSISPFMPPSIPGGGGWNHLIVWYDASAQLIGIRQNGGTVTTTPHTTGIQILPGADFQIGGDQGAVWYGLNGMVDATGKWDRRLTLDEENFLFNCGFGKQYPFA